MRLWVAPGPWRSWGLEERSFNHKRGPQAKRWQGWARDPHLLATCSPKTHQSTLAWSLTVANQMHKKIYNFNSWGQLKPAAVLLCSMELLKVCTVVFSIEHFWRVYAASSPFNFSYLKSNHSIKSECKPWAETIMPINKLPTKMLSECRLPEILQYDLLFSFSLEIWISMREEKRRCWGPGSCLLMHNSWLWGTWPMHVLDKLRYIPRYNYDLQGYGATQKRINCCFVREVKRALRRDNMLFERNTLS